MGVGGDGSRHADRAVTVFRLRSLRGIVALGRLDHSVDAVHGAIRGPHQGHGPSTEARHRRVNDGQHESSRDRGVHRAASSRQHLDTGVGGARVRGGDHAVSRTRDLLRLFLRLFRERTRYPALRGRAHDEECRDDSRSHQGKTSLL